MKKKGPCWHCGINSTPLWRKGPNEKPVLCNACGSRFKVKGTLQNYLPKSSLHHLSLLNLVPRTGGTNTNLWWNKIPKRKRSLVGHKWSTPMEKFQKQLLSLWHCSQSNESSSEETLLIDNVNNFIPRNEIGLGCIILKTDDTNTSADQDHSHALQ